MVSLTGSTVAGRRIGAVAAETIKRVSLELGGKSPLIVLEDADIPTAVVGGLSACYLNSGQTCIALDANDRPSLQTGRSRSGGQIRRRIHQGG